MMKEIVFDYKLLSKHFILNPEFLKEETWEIDNSIYECVNNLLYDKVDKKHIENISFIVFLKHEKHTIKSNDKNRKDLVVETDELVKLEELFKDDNSEIESIIEIEIIKTNPRSKNKTHKLKTKLKDEILNLIRDRITTAKSNWEKSKNNKIFKTVPFEKQGGGEKPKPSREHLRETATGLHNYFKENKIFNLIGNRAENNRTIGCLLICAELMEEERPKPNVKRESIHTEIQPLDKYVENLYYKDKLIK